MSSLPDWCRDLRKTMERRLRHRTVHKIRFGCTGHRPQKIGKEWMGVGSRSDKIREFFRNAFNAYRPDEVVSGMALGVDQICAEVALEMGIPVVAAIPFHGQQNVWTDECKERYTRILNHPLCRTEVVTRSEHYSRAAMHIRNRHMVDTSLVMLSVWNGSKGGTAATVEYAYNVSCPVFNLNPRTWKVHDARHFL